jgi:hypothetical protein
VVVNERFEDFILKGMFDFVALARDGYCLGTAGGGVFLDDALDQVVFQVFCGA